MSVLFKALQKAEKENEQRQAVAAETSFDAGRLAGSGAIKFAGSRSVNWRTAGLAAAVVLAIAIAGAFFLVGPGDQPPARVAAVVPPPAAKPAMPGTTETIPVMQPPAPLSPPVAPVAGQQPLAPPPVTPATPSAPDAVAAAVSAPVVASAAQDAAANTEPVPSPAVAEAPSKPTAVPASKSVKSVAAPVPSPSKQPALDLAPDSPARMLNPPISLQKADFDLSGVGNAVRVREVSQMAQDNVGAGYNALVSGAYDMSLGFYERALKEEPSSVLALLGHGASLQKLGKIEEARVSYEKVLKIDPGNREALSNLTVMLSERSPTEALTKLIELEKEYPSFSPIKAQIGLAYAKIQAMPEALDYLRRATALSPESVMYQYNMALVLDHLGRSEQAVAVYQTVLASIQSGRSAPDLSATDIERRVRFLRKH